jgi:hypothetical protein
MSNREITDLLIVCAAVFGLAAFIGLIVAPAWSSYSRLWERVAATLLSLYVLAALVAIGAVGALVAVWLAKT